MKKQLIAVLMAAGFTMSAGLASAAPTAFTGNSEVTGGSTGNCTLLAENVTLGVSSKVHGAWACDEALNLVQVAACHEGGSRAGVTCAATPVLDAQGVATGEVTYQAGCSAETVGQQSSIPSYGAFFASSAGGVMVQQPMDGRCDNTTVVGIDGF